MVYVESYFYNKMEFLVFNSTVGSYVGYSSVGISLANNKNHDEYLLPHERGSVDRFCKVNAHVYKSHGLDKNGEKMICEYSISSLLCTFLVLGLGVCLVHGMIFLALLAENVLTCWRHSVKSTCAKGFKIVVLYTVFYINVQLKSSFPNLYSLYTFSIKLNFKVMSQGAKNLKKYKVLLLLFLVNISKITLLVFESGNDKSGNMNSIAIVPMLTEN